MNRVTYDVARVLEEGVDVGFGRWRRRSRRVSSVRGAWGAFHVVLTDSVTGNLEQALDDRRRQDENGAIRKVPRLPYPQSEPFLGRYGRGAEADEEAATRVP
jgi:hypothetical protein